MPQASANTPVGETREKNKARAGKFAFQRKISVRKIWFLVVFESSKKLTSSKEGFFDALDHRQLRVAKLAPVNAPF